MIRFCVQRLVVVLYLIVRKKIHEKYFLYS
jgi:hypothetical protein